MIKRPWRWLLEHKNEIDLLARLVTITAGLAGAIAFVWKYSAPDPVVTREVALALKVEHASTPLPDDVARWFDDVILFVEATERRAERHASDRKEFEEILTALEEFDNELPKTVARMPRVHRTVFFEAIDNFEDAVKLAKSSPVPLDTTKGLNGDTWTFREAARVRVTLQNKTDRQLDRVRLKVTDMSTIWRASLRADFLASEELKLWSKGIPRSRNSSTNFEVTFPELPSIPPRASVIVDAYGAVRADSKAAITSGHSFELHDPLAKPLPVAAPEPKTFWQSYRDALPYGLIGSIVLLFFWRKDQSAIEEAKPRLAFSWAKWLVAQGHNDAALALLRIPVRAGAFIDEIQNDPELEPLRTLDDYASLLDEMKRR
jgi:hypothetical protein